MKPNVAIMAPCCDLAFILLKCIKLHPLIATPQWRVGQVTFDLLRHFLKKTTVIALWPSGLGSCVRWLNYIMSTHGVYGSPEGTKHLHYQTHRTVRFSTLLITRYQTSDIFRYQLLNAETSSLSKSYAFIIKMSILNIKGSFLCMLLLSDYCRRIQPWPRVDVEPEGLFLTGKQFDRMI